MVRILKFWRTLIIFGSLLASVVRISAATEVGALTAEAREIYRDFHEAVVQIRVVSRGSGEKASLGSGFHFSTDGLIATNYHVVAEAVNEPERFSVEYVTASGQRGEVEIVNIDPVHDLAVVQPQIQGEKFLELGDSDFKKGARIFAFGNPHDLGMIVVDGLFNGLVENARYRKILFSGALNPGMSGGPAIGMDGRVVGINVATSGNDLSFIVPVEFLAELYVEILAARQISEEPLNWKEIIRRRLIADQDVFLKGILSKQTWDKRQIGLVKVPGEISEAFRCWADGGGDRREYWVQETLLDCSVADGVYLSQTLNTAQVDIHYEWYQSRDENPIRFYNLFEKYASQRRYRFRNAGSEDVANFDCERNFFVLDGRRAKLEFCARRYLDFDELFDVSVQVTSLHSRNGGLVFNLYALGVTESQTQVFLERFLKEISWIE